MIIRIFTSSNTSRRKFREVFPNAQVQIPVGQSSYFDANVTDRSLIVPITEWATHSGYSYETHGE